MNKRHTLLPKMGLRRSIFLIMILVFSLLLITCGDKPKEKLVPRAVKVYEVKKASTLEYRRLSGTVAPTNFVDLSFSVGGHVEMIRTKLGARINKGKLLAVLKKKKFQLRVDTAKARLDKATALLFEKVQRYKATSTLFKDGYISVLDFRRVEANYKVATNQLSLAKAELEIAKDNLAKTNLYAPFNGRIAQTYVDRHMEVKPGQPIMKFHGLKKFEVTIDVPDNMIGRIKLADKVEIEYVTLSNKKGSGVIAEIATHSSLSNAFPVVISIVKPPKALRSGMIVEVVFGFKLKDVGQIFLVPITAVLPGRTQQEGYVFLYDAKTKIVKKHYIQAAQVRGNYLEVIKGLKKGDKIAISGVRFLRDGQKVSLYKQED